jgi:hypothetical protein
MTIRVFSDEDLERLRSFPEINREELIRFFTLTPADVEFIDPGRGRGPRNRLGLAVQLCTLPWLGFVPDDVISAPAVPVARLSERLQVPWVSFAPTGNETRPAPITCDRRPVSRVASGECAGARRAG